MQKNVKLTHSPVSPSVEVVGDMVMVLHGPYSTDAVTMQFNPRIDDYKEKDDRPGVQIRQIMVTVSTPETRTAQFDFGKHNTHSIVVSGRSYTVQLLSIGKEKLEGQDFPFFEFLVSWD
jgi:hypothetical protein